MSPYDVFNPLSPNRRGHVGWDWPESPDLNIAELPESSAQAGDELVTIVDTAIGTEEDSRPANEAAAASEAPTEPPTTLDRASPPPAATRSASSSPNPASRAWLEEYDHLFPSSSSTIFTLGRRRREDDSGPSSRRRLRHTDGGRDTRRDAIIFSPAPEGWLDNMILHEPVPWLPRDLGLGPSADGGPEEGSATVAETASAGATPAPDAAAASGTGTPVPEPPVLVRTTSLTAVGGDRPVAPLPRRRTSALSTVD